MLVILSEMRGRSSLREDNEVFQGRGTLDFRALVVATAPFLTLLITATVVGRQDAATALARRSPSTISGSLCAALGTALWSASKPRRDAMDARRERALP